jgi:hypothetical protein
LIGFDSPSNFEAEKGREARASFARLKAAERWLQNRRNPRVFFRFHQPVAVMEMRLHSMEKPGLFQGSLKLDDFVATIN